MYDRQSRWSGGIGGNNIFLTEFKVIKAFLQFRNFFFQVPNFLFHILIIPLENHPHFVTHHVMRISTQCVFQKLLPDSIKNPELPPALQKK
ncbi:hypothetical protein B7991_00490 [Fibrobacter sp. UWB3]|nr:hypothetical protein B7991_00490 [Fibrobacter sp. UWB3]